MTPKYKNTYDPQIVDTQDGPNTRQEKQYDHQS